MDRLPQRGRDEAPSFEFPFYRPRARPRYRRLCLRTSHSVASFLRSGLFFHREPFLPSTIKDRSRARPRSRARLSKTIKERSPSSKRSRPALSFKLVVGWGSGLVGGGDSVEDGFAVGCPNIFDMRLVNIPMSALRVHVYCGLIFTTPGRTESMS